MKRLLLLLSVFLSMGVRGQVVSTETGRAKEYTDFLYQYMPLCDRADYPRSFFYTHASLTLQALRELPWGQMLNDTLVRHFILPPRVNNEPLDSFRIQYYKELSLRVQGLTMTEAAIAVNHWCHEKVTYQPSDGRTSSPLQSIRTAYGRCGEESTLCVAAMRTVGIPARQVYTPRWAHCDDNHAWVEVWTDGAWHFLGACEPEPVLDLGWFNAPASRGMLMHTCVFGNYQGPEDVIRRTPTFTEINVTSHYAKTRRVFVRALMDGKPVENAVVEFKIYNYAEFYSAVTRRTDANGLTSLVSGYGDLLVWVSKDGRYGYQKVDFAHDTLVEVDLSHTANDLISDSIDIHVPRAAYHLPFVSVAQRSANDLALHREDSLRAAYESTMPALLPNATAQDSILWKSRGNARTIKTFIDKYGDRALALLRTLSDKDLRDVTRSVLEDHRRNSSTDDPHVLCPRVSLEPLSPWRGVFQSRFHFDSVAAIQAWCNDNLRLSNDSNVGGTFVTPLGVLEKRCGDRRSLDVFFVSLCRAMHFAAWLDPVTGAVCTADERNLSLSWHSLPAQALDEPMGTLRFAGEPTLGYINHFTVSRLTDAGTLSLLTFPEEAPLSSLTAQPLPAGTYFLTTGTRQRSGDILTTLSTFRIVPGQETLLQVVPRTDIDTSTIYGHLDDIHQPTVIALIAEGHEPSNHVVRDICLRRTDFEQTQTAIQFVFGSELQLQKFRKEDFAPFPRTSTFSVDQGGSLLEKISKALPLHNASNLPLVLFVDEQGDVRYYNQGYTIGIGETLMRHVQRSLSTCH